MPAERCAHGFLRPLCDRCGSPKAAPIVHEEVAQPTPFPFIDPQDDGLGGPRGIAVVLGVYLRLALFALVVGFTGCSELEVPIAVASAPPGCAAGLLDSAGKFVCVEWSNAEVGL